MKSPSVICPARMARPPTTIMMTPMTPTTTVENAVIADTPVIDCAMLRNSRLTPLREDELLALLRGVGLDDPDAAERFVQPAGDLGVDLAALAEERPQPLERERHRAAERRQRDERDAASATSSGRTDTRAPTSAVTTLPVSWTRPVPTRFRMPSASVMMREIRTPDCVESKIADRQARDVRFDAAAHVGDRALRGHAEHLRQRERRHRLDEGRGAGGERQRHQQVRAPLADHVVDQVLRRRRQHQPGEPVDQHQREPETQAAAARPDEPLRLLPGGGRQLLSSSGRPASRPRRRRAMAPCRARLPISGAEAPMPIAIVFYDAFREHERLDRAGDARRRRSSP